MIQTTHGSVTSSRPPFCKVLNLFRFTMELWDILAQDWRVLMTTDEHDKWLYVLSSGFAYQDIKIRVLKSILVQAGIMTAEQLDKVMAGATEQNFRVTRHRFIRTLQAMFDEHSPDEAELAWLEGMGALERQRPMKESSRHEDEDAGDS